MLLLCWNICRTCSSMIAGLCGDTLPWLLLIVSLWWCLSTWVCIDYMSRCLFLSLPLLDALFHDFWFLSSHLVGVVCGCSGILARVGGLISGIHHVPWSNRGSPPKLVAKTWLPIGGRNWGMGGLVKSERVGEVHGKGTYLDF